MSLEKLVFFLGGQDLEMQTIAELLAEVVAPERIHDKRLAWGAKACDYGTELDAAFSEGLIPVLIELTIDRSLPESTIVIDHHNERAGASKPTSLEQIFELLRLPSSRWTRRYSLVAANDRGYLPEMVSIGATREEMIAIREDDRRSQGITSDEEEQASEAIAHRALHADGNLTFITIPHTRTAAVADRMEPLLDGPGYTNLLIGTPRSVALYGTGTLIELARNRVPNSWWGGALPERGYWGANVPVQQVLGFLVEAATTIQ